MTHIILAGLLYALCGQFAYAGCFAYFQRHFPLTAPENYRTDRRMACLFGLTGPVGFLVVFLFSGFFKYGLKWV